MAPVADRKPMAGVWRASLPQSDCGRVAEHAGAIPFSSGPNAIRGYGHFQVWPVSFLSLALVNNPVDGEIEGTSGREGGSTAES